MNPPVNITIPLEYLAELICEGNPYQGTRAHSRVEHDVFIPLCCRWDLGHLLLKLDPEELYFHVELIQPFEDVERGQKIQNAEVWYSPQWRESLSKRVALRRACKVSTAEHIHKRWQFDIIVAKFLELRMPEATAKEQVNAILDTHGKPAPNGTIVDYTQLMVSLKLDPSVLNSLPPSNEHQ
jgi:hypothetical protein